jgi:hypothetical protein
VLAFQAINRFINIAPIVASLAADAIASVALEIPVPPGFRMWTDDFNNLLHVLK